MIAAPIKATEAFLKVILAVVLYLGIWITILNRGIDERDSARGH